MKHLRFFLPLMFLCALFACKPDVPPVDPDEPAVDTTILVDTTIIIDTTTIIDPVVTRKGILIINEGNMGDGNASLSYYDPEKDSVANYVFTEANGGAPIGDVGQSLALIDGKLFIVVNNSNKIYKADVNTFVCDINQPYQITGFYSPRFMLPVAPDKAYVSDIVGTDLWIINPQTMTHTGTVAMGKSTENMLQVDNEIYVSNWSRFYVDGMVNNTVQVVDLVNDVKTADVEVGFEPNFMAKDKNGHVWVMCEGDVNDPSVPSELWKIDPNTKTSTKVMAFEKKALNLAIDPTGTYLYFVYGGDWVTGGDVRRVCVDNPTEMDNFVISGSEKMFYKLYVDPFNGDIYIADSKNYTVDGAVYRYSSEGVLLNSFNVGICPGFILFY